MEQILVDLKKSLQEITGDRLIKMVLFGSCGLNVIPRIKYTVPGILAMPRRQWC